MGVFKYLVRLMDWSNGDWPAVRRNIRKVIQVRGKLDKLLRKEGEEPFVSAKFYWAEL